MIESKQGDSNLPQLFRYAFAAVCLLSAGLVLAHVVEPPPLPFPSPSGGGGGTSGGSGGGGAAAPEVSRIAMSPANLTLDGVAGSAQGATGLAQVVIYDAAQGSWSSSTTAIWLSISPRSGKDDERVTISADASRLAPGTYTGSVLINVANASNSPYKFDVTLRVRALEPSTLRASPATVTFQANAEGSAPAAVRLAITHQGEQLLNWTAATSTLNGGAWLTANKAAGKTPDELVVTAQVGRLLPGTYSGRVTLSSREATNGSLQVPVNLVVTRRGLTLSGGAVVNIADYQAGPIAPGQLLAIFGKDLGPADGVAYQARNGKVPEELGGTAVSFDGRPAPVLFASAGQLTVQAPYEIEGRAETRVKVTTSTAETNEVVLKVVASAPAIFRVGERPAVYSTENVLLDTETPVAAGSLVQISMNGMGSTTPKVETGDVVRTAVDPQPAFNAPISATLGGRPARVVSATLVPGLVSVAQILLEIPRDLPDGTAALDITVGETTVSAGPLNVRALPVPQ